VAKAASEIPNKLFYKIGEVCEITDTQPYVLRFWESEFPQLAPRKNRSGQRVYQRKDIDTVMRIKRLLYEEEYTIAGARKKLDDDPAADGHPEIAAVTAPPAAGPAAVHAQAEAAAARRAAAAEHEHPVDLLAARIERQARPVDDETIASDPEREARLDAALAELKKQLREVLALLAPR